jgi:isoamylase
MLLARNEFRRTQQGNNNAYCQDDEISWLNWNLGDKGKSLTRFVQKVIALRHEYPILRPSRFLVGAHGGEVDVKDLTWINASGNEMTGEEWADAGMRCFGMLMDGRAQPTGNPAARNRGYDAPDSGPTSRPGAVYVACAWNSVFLEGAH